jgi:hypothetical protein
LGNTGERKKLAISSTYTRDLPAPGVPGRGPYFKPDNVLIDNAGRPRVGDFGLAFARGAADPLEEATTLTSSDDVATREDAPVGTPAYMAPEQFVRPDVDERADQFSLCAALYEAVYGVRPFRGANFDELRASAQEGALQPPAPGSTAPPGLDAVLRRGLARDPAARWPSLDELLDRLDEIEAQRDPATAGRERRRLLVTVAASCALALGAPHVDGAVSAAEIPVATMTAMAAAMLATLAVAVYLLRGTLLRSTFHRRMIAAVAGVMLGYVVIPPIAAGVGLSSEQIAFVELLATAQAFLLAGCLVAPTLLLNVAVCWAGAVGIALGASVVAVQTTTTAAAVLVLAVAWSRAPAARRVLFPLAEAGATRPGA